MQRSPMPGEGASHGVGERKNTKRSITTDDAQYGKTKHGKFMTEADGQGGRLSAAKASPIARRQRRRGYFAANNCAGWKAGQAGNR